MRNLLVPLVPQGTRAVEPVLSEVEESPPVRASPERFADAFRQVPQVCIGFDTGTWEESGIATARSSCGRTVSHRPRRGITLISMGTFHRKKRKIKSRALVLNLMAGGPF